MTAQEPVPKQQPASDLRSRRDEQLSAFATELGITTSDKTNNKETSPSTKDGGAVFVCVDMEAFEFKQSLILEIGIATIFSEHLGALESDPEGSKVESAIRCEHYLIKENRGYVNKKFVRGCPKDFRFGQSKTVPIALAKSNLQEYLHDPRAASKRAGYEHDMTAPAPRKYVVGHGLSNDKTYMKQLGIDADYGAKEVDTQKLTSSKADCVGLGRLLTALGIPNTFLHNAGNDAYYTLQALMRMIHLHATDPTELDRRIGLTQALPSTGKRTLRYMESGEPPKVATDDVSLSTTDTKTLQVAGENEIAKSNRTGVSESESQDRSSKPAVPVREGVRKTTNGSKRVRADDHELGSS